MTPALDFFWVLLAGIGAGAVNTAIGSGSLITYPALLLAGLPPVVANVTNTVGLVPGSAAGAWAFRRELKGQGRMLALLLPVSAVGAIGGGVLLLALPSTAFEVIVPVLVIVAALLVGLAPLIARRLGEQHDRPRPGALAVTVGAAGVYGGYFSAAQGIILLGVLGLFHRGDIHVQNALKNVLQGVVNLVAAIFFVVVADVHYGFALAVAIGSLIGAPIGAWLARKANPTVFRTIVVVFGVVVGVVLIFT